MKTLHGFKGLHLHNLPLVAIAMMVGLFCLNLPITADTRMSDGAPPIATFSIVARDSVTGELGVAVASKFFAVGNVVPWAKADIGAVELGAVPLGDPIPEPATLSLLALGGLGLLRRRRRK